MSKPVILTLALIVTLATWRVLIVADLGAVEIKDGQPFTKEGFSGDRTQGRQSSTVDDATCSSDTCSRIVVGLSESNIEVALSSSDSLASGSPAINDVPAEDTTISGTVAGRSECAGSNGTTDERVTGRLLTGNRTAVGGNSVTIGGNVTASGGHAMAGCIAVGGDAAVIISSKGVESFIDHSTGGDFWALLRTLLIQFANDVAAGRTDGSVSAGGHVLCTSSHAAAAHGSIVVGGSAVFLGGNGGIAVGGSATVLGVVGGKLQVLCHAAGEISHVSRSVASGGVVTVP